MTKSAIAETGKALSGLRAIDILVLICLIALLLVMLLPLLLIVINSFKTEPEYYANGPFALPQQLNFDGIVATWQSTDYTTKLINSMIISLSTAVLATLLSLFIQAHPKFCLPSYRCNICCDVTLPRCVRLLLASLRSAWHKMQTARSMVALIYYLFNH